MDEALLLLDEIEENVNPFSEENIRNLYNFSKEVMTIEHTSYVYTYAHFDSSMSQADIIAFWDDSEDENLTSEEKYNLDLKRNFHIESSVGNNVILVIVGIEGEQSSEDSRDVVRSIRSLESKNDQFGSQSTVNVAGIAAYNQDILEAVAENMPIALVCILISS